MCLTSNERGSRPGPKYGVPQLTDAKRGYLPPLCEPKQTRKKAKKACAFTRKLTDHEEWTGRLCLAFFASAGGRWPTENGLGWAGLGFRSTVEAGKEARHVAKGKGKKIRSLTVHGRIALDRLACDGIGPAWGMNGWAAEAPSTRQASTGTITRTNDTGGVCGWVVDLWCAVRVISHQNPPFRLLPSTLRLNQPPANSFPSPPQEHFVTPPAKLIAMSSTISSPLRLGKL